jgi:DNA repair exonuclease SbcCD ATPase subunit
VQVETAPQDARGGGVVDVISLALRLALLEAFRPPVGGPVILDEPAKHVSEEFAPQVAQFLKSFSQSLGRQVIMVSHNQHLADSADVAYLVEMAQGRSSVRRIR